jgi:hypothetical protein
MNHDWTQLTALLVAVTGCFVAATGLVKVLKCSSRERCGSGNSAVGSPSQ